MSVQLLDEVRRCSRASPPARLVLAWIAFHHHHEDPTRTVALDAEQLGDETGHSRSALYRHLTELYSLGELVKLGGGGGRGKVTRWRIPELAERDSYARRWRTPERPLGRPLVAEAKPSQDRDGFDELNRPRKRPDTGTVSSRVKSAGLTGTETPPSPPASGGERSTMPALRSLGTNPRALAAQARLDAAARAATESVAAMRPPTAEDERAAGRVLEAMRASVPEHVWALWLSKLSLAAVSAEGALVLSGPDEAVAWAQGRATRLVEACSAQTGVPARIAGAAEAAALRRAA